LLMLNGLFWKISKAIGLIVEGMSL